MTQYSSNLEVTKDHAVPVTPPQGGTAVVTIAAGDSTLYYAYNQQVSAGNNQGTITAGIPVGFATEVWIVSSGLSAVRIDYLFPVPNQPSGATTVLTPSGGDDSQAFLQAVTVGGTILLAPGTFTFATSVGGGNPSAAAVTKNTPTRVIGSGRGVTICQFSGGVQQLIGFNRTADYDSFSQIAVSDLSIDAGNIANLHNTGAILGTGFNGTVQSRINIDRVYVARVDAINVPLNSGMNGGVYLAVAHTAVGETQTNITNVRIDDVKVSGGAFGIIVQGNGPASAGTGTSGTNVFMDHIHISNWYHDTGSAPTGAIPSGASCMIGNSGFGGEDILIENGYGKFSPDVGIEVDALQNVVVRNVVIEDAWNGDFYHTNYRDPPYPAGQRVVFQNCRSRCLTGANAFPAFAIANHASATPLGTVEYLNCSYYSNKPNPYGAVGEAFGTQSAGVLINKIRVDGFESTMEGMSDAGAGSTDVMAGWYALATAPAVRPTVTIKDLKISISGAMTGGGSDFPIGVRFDGMMYLKIDGIDFDTVWTAPNGGTKVIDIGRATANIGGVIKRVRVRRIPASPVPIGIVIRSTATLTIPNLISIEDFDGSALTTNSALYSLDATQIGKVIVSRLRGPVWPKPSTTLGVSNFVSGTFTSTVANQYIGPESGEVQFLNGSGAGITAIDVSKDGVTYENVWTQASGVMAQTVLAPVEPGDFVKVTFATTQPTTRVRFQRS